LIGSTGLISISTSAPLWLDVRPDEASGLDRLHLDDLDLHQTTSLQRSI
jgi:hypothetical protein